MSGPDLSGDSLGNKAEKATGRLRSIMVRVKIVRDHPSYTVGDVIAVSRNVAHGLIDSGYGVISKDMTQRDYKVRSYRGRSSVVRPNKSGRR